MHGFRSNSQVGKSRRRKQ